MAVISFVMLAIGQLAFRVPLVEHLSRPGRDEHRPGT